MNETDRLRMERWIREHCGPNHFGEQDAEGVDLSLIRANLKLTPAQRLSRGEAARREVQWIHAHARRR